MSFGDAIKSFFTNYANFKGRARRSEFWYSYLFVAVIGFVLNLVVPGQPVDLGNGIVYQGVGILYSLWALATFIPLLAVVWRRLHDVNTSGGYFFMCLIPLVGPILLIVKWATAGNPGPNQYGNQTK